MTAAGSVVVRIYGTPAPQGSKRIVAGGARVIEDNHDAKMAWRGAVELACHTTARMASLALPFTGPVAVVLELYVPPPKSKPAWRYWSWRKPDLDKLVRSTLDGASGYLFTDDARVVELHTRKLYADADEFRAGATLGVVDLAADEDALRDAHPDDRCPPRWTPLSRFTHDHTRRVR